jgi:hypothetical protein
MGTVDQLILIDSTMRKEYKNIVIICLSHRLLGYSKPYCWAGFTATVLQKRDIFG